MISRELLVCWRDPVCRPAKHSRRTAPSRRSMSSSSRERRQMSSSSCRTLGLFAEAASWMAVYPSSSRVLTLWPPYVRDQRTVSSFCACETR